MKNVLLSAGIIFALGAYAQQPSQEKSKQPAPESPQHRYARHEYADLLARILKYWHENFPDPKYPYQKLVDTISDFRNLPWEADAMSPISEQLARTFERETDKVRLLQLRMDTADGCALLYRNTIDKKTSDLTTREADLIKGCKSIENYPPAGSDDNN